MLPNLRIGTWNEEIEKLTCPYCLNEFTPRRFSDLVMKQCPVCHRYFLLPRNLVLKLVSDKKNMGMVREQVQRKMGLNISDMTDKELQSYVIELIQEEKLQWDSRGWFYVSNI